MDTRRFTAILVALGRRWLGTRQLNHLVRFEPVLALVLSAGSPGGTLLDVGSGSQGIARLLPDDWCATAVDANFDDYAPTSGPRRLASDQQVGDVRALPFEDARFDVTVAVDLIEHIAAADRAQAVSEICRVSRRRAVIACPAGEAALRADRRLAAHFTRDGRPVPPWLQEHLQNGFPAVAELVAAATRFGEVRTLGNESISAHERLVAAEHRILPALALRLACRPLERLMTSRRPQARQLSTGVLRRVRGRDREPAYRVVVVVDRI
jgi:ubiquinone/menaquinone biosynthesis C-methylase UbiE